MTAAALSVALTGLIVIVTVLARVDTDSHEAVQEPIIVFPDFASIQSVEVKKQQFFDYLQDYIVAENEKIAATRQQLSSYVAITNSDVALSDRERDWVLGLAQTYRVETGQLSDRKIVDELMLRVDMLPVSMALAQAANESAWGTSRFALEGNNVFGQRCYAQGCGMVPSRRHEDARHEVRSFDSVERSVHAYFLNINSHPSYRYLRWMRAGMRIRQQTLDSMVLAVGLGRYSERGEHYVDEVRNIIIQNNLRSRDKS